MKNYFETGTLVGWADDGEVETFDTIAEAAEQADCTEEELIKALGTDKDFGGTTYFRYGIDVDATEGYDDARAEAEAYEAE